MKCLSLVILLISSSVFANHLETVCKSALQPYPGRAGYFVSNPPKFSENFIARSYFNEEGRINVVENFDGIKIYQLADKIRGLNENQNSLWLLQDYELVNITTTGVLIARHPFVFNPNPQTAKAVSMTKVGELLLIARGRDGLTAFNMETQKILWHTDLLEVDGGKPVAIAFDGDHGQAIFTSTREGGFNGVVTIDIENGKVLGQTPYNRRRAGVISPDAVAHWNNDSLIINNGGWIHVLTQDQIQTRKPVKPKWVAVEVGDDLHLHYMMLSGDFFIENNKLFGCGMMNERNGDQVTRFARLFEVQLD